MIEGAERAASFVSPCLHDSTMNMKDWLSELQREIDCRVNAAVRRGALTSADEELESRLAPNGERVHFSIRGILEDGDGSQDPGWMEPA